jgi:hypothetical protein
VKRFKVAFSLIFIGLLLFGVSAIDASPVSLGNAARFAALSLNGNVNNSNGTITGPVGVAASGFSYSGDSSFTSDLYVNTGSTITLGGATPSNVFQSASTNTLLSQAVTDANNASAAATAQGPGTNLGNINGTNNLTNTAVGNYVYTVGTVANNTTINISAPPGSTVIVNITGTVGMNVNFNIAGGLLPNDVLYNVTGPDAFNQGGGTDITGILLAPNSTVTVNGGAIVTGQVIAKAVTTTGSGDIIFNNQASTPPTPEPPSLGMVAIATAALLGHRFLWRRKSPG